MVIMMMVATKNGGDDDDGGGGGGDDDDEGDDQHLQAVLKLYVWHISQLYSMSLAHIFNPTET